MSIQHGLKLRFLGLLALCLIGVSVDHCFGGDPKILPIKLTKIDASAKIDPQSQGGSTLLPRRKIGFEQLSSMSWRGSCNAALLTDGADPNATSPAGEPILFDIIRNDRGQDELEDFLRAGADPNRMNRDGRSPLHEAIWRGNSRAVKLLLKFGADPLAKSSGQTAIEYAISHQKELVKLLKADRPAPVKLNPIQPPVVLRQPDTVFGSTLFRPPTGGEAVIYLEDSSQVISGGSDGAIRFFDATTGEIQNVIAAHESEILELARIPSSNIIVSSGSYATKFWDVKTSRELMRLQGGGRGLSVSPNGRWVFSGYHLWQIESVDPLRLAAQGRGYPQAGGKVIISWTFFTPNNRYLIFGVQNGFVYIWDLSNDKVRRLGDLKTTEMSSLKWGDMKGMVDIGSASPDEVLALATSQYTILTGPSATLKTFQPVVAEDVRDARSLACSPNGQYLAALGYPSRIDIYDLEQGGKRIALRGHTASLLTVAASPDGSLIASGGNDKTVRIWDRRTGSQLKLIKTASFVYSLCFSPDGKRLAIGDNNSNVTIFEIRTGTQKKCRVHGRITGLNFNTEGNVLIALGFDVAVIDTVSGEKLASISSGEAQQGTLAVTPENLIIGGARSMSAGETFKVPCAWSFDDDQLTPNRDLFSEAMGHRSTIHAVATSPDGSLLAAESNSTIRLWSLRKQQPVGDKMCGHTYGINDIKFSPDGKLLASGAWDGTARIWEIPSGRLLLVLDADVYRVSGVDFLPDGSLVTANWNGTVHLWDVPKHLARRNK